MRNSLRNQQKLAFILPDMRGGGAERVALRLIEDFLQRGHKVDLVLMAARGELMELVPPEVRVIDLGARRIRNALFPIRRYFLRERPDAVQISMWPLTVVAVLANKLARSKARLVLSDHIMLSKQYAYLGKIGLAILGLSIRLAYPRASARIAVSKQAADDLARLSGVARDKFEVVYNPVAAPSLHPQSATDVEGMWGSRGGRIITVGSLKEQKNHALLIRSFANLLRTRPAKLMILGEGELRGRLAELAADEGIEDHLIMPGFFADPWPFYATADLFVLSSDYEGYPLVLIEAMRSGLSVVSTDCESGPSEILAGGTYGILVPCGDSKSLAEGMLQALDNPTEPQILKARADEISGPATSIRYLELMTAEAG